MNRLKEMFPELLSEAWDVSVGEGWEKLVADALSQAPEGVKVLQIKEKFGGLRLYWKINIPFNANDVVKWQDVVKNAEMLADETCEVCGEKGKLQSKRRWWKTLCDKCVERP